MGSVAHALQIVPLAAHLYGLDHRDPCVLRSELHVKRRAHTSELGPIALA